MASSELTPTPGGSAAKSTVVLSPTWPYPLYPSTTVPGGTRAGRIRPRKDSRPGKTWAMKVLFPGVVPSPSCPEALFPQQRSVPSLPRAHE